MAVRHKLPLLKDVPAIVMAWYFGMEGGHALARVLFGDVNPGGRLPYTVYASDDQVPPQDVYDISKGFTYMYVKGDPLFAFGHGLSYTAFAYSNLQVSPRQVAPDGTFRCDAPRVHLRGRVPPAHDRQGTQPRHRVVLDHRQRVAGARDCVPGLARSRQFRRRRPATAALAWRLNDEDQTDPLHASRVRPCRRRCAASPSCECVVVAE